jgi:methyl-accepting chemotaxis protein
MEKELVWLPKELAQQFESATNPDLAEQIILHHIELMKRDIQISIESLDDDILRFKTKGLEYRSALNAAWSAEYEKLQQLFNDQQAKINEIREQIKTQAKAIEPLTQEAQRLTEKLASIPTYRIEETAKAVEHLLSVMAQVDEKMFNKFIKVLTDE